ncbi:MAG: hypothetical protein EA383_06730 [Spirochaetaceae bacterium]|nr:MAG: hypothetical protein EA383_06730 [Spirochaetaceae bacterium]
MGAQLTDIHRPLPFLNNGVAQIAFIVEDLDEALEMYHSRFNVGGWDVYTYQRPLVSHMTYMGVDADYAMRIGLSYFGTMRIELIQPLRGPSVYHDHIERNGYGIHHLGVLVDDMHAALGEAEQAGFRMIMDGAGFGLDGDGHYAYLDTEDTLGVMYELIERPKARREPEKRYP